MFPQAFSFFFIASCLCISYWKYRNVFHPHFVFTLMWIYLLPLGAIVQPEPAEDLVRIHGAKLELLKNYNYLIHGYLGSLFFLTLLAARQGPSLDFSRMKGSIVQFRKIAPNIGLFGLVILGAQFLRQLSASDWSMDAWLGFTFGARFGRPWMGQYVGGSEFIYTFLGALFPISGVALAFAVNFARQWFKLLFFGGLMFLLLMQVGDGARTPMALTVITFAGCWWVSRSGAARYIGATFAVSLFILLVSLMARFRGEGLSTMDGMKDLSTIEYHQDDNYFRLLNTMLVAESGQDENWDASTFITAALVNPVPRFLWPAKPLLEQDFYGSWKWSHVTITYIGEWTAMFGISMGLFVSLVFACGVFALLQLAYKRFRKPGGLILYIGLVFYLYMVCRSIYNIGMFTIFITGVLLIYFYLSKKSASISKPVASRMRPRRIQGAF